jgi:hypothetical protein
VGLCEVPSPPLLSFQCVRLACLWVIDHVVVYGGGSLLWTVCTAFWL